MVSVGERETGKVGPDETEKRLPVTNYKSITVVDMPLTLGCFPWCLYETTQSQSDLTLNQS